MSDIPPGLRLALVEMLADCLVADLTEHPKDQPVAEPTGTIGPDTARARAGVTGASA